MNFWQCHHLWQRLNLLGPPRRHAKLDHSGKSAPSHKNWAAINSGLNNLQQVITIACSSEKQRNNVLSGQVYPNVLNSRGR